ncbi:MAG: hypothetical protein DHS20C16_08850 [Phycisphaerae bacterium]|nr:MAG: hypothetical protein DHS20C16_08850 [Phycisphaerae bacterium]
MRPVRWTFKPQATSNTFNKLNACETPTPQRLDRMLSVQTTSLRGFPPVNSLYRYDNGPEIPFQVILTGKKYILCYRQVVLDIMGSPPHP